jgi:hypothetical protein
MNNFRYTLVCTAALASCFAVRAVHADEPGSWFIHGGLAYADFHATATVSDQQVPGGGVFGLSP